MPFGLGKGSGAGLVVRDSITVKSQGGDCRIDLCFGDITELPTKERVDVIFVSAFGSNYARRPGTVIGALYDKLGLDVGDLADDKEEDLRSLYSCWWSKPLPRKIPYDRLLCFESRTFRDGKPQELVGHAFRCLVPILKNKDASVITPLLSTGNQGFDPKVMLEGMVHAAVSWVKAGLPMRLLKIVIYASVKNGKVTFIRGADNETVDKFLELKSKYESANLLPKEVHLEYDVYLSFSGKDQEVAKRIQNQLQQEKPDIRIFTSRQEIDSDAIWQEQMYDVMQKSARVITGHEWQRTLYHSIDGSLCMLALISPSYLKSAVCMEEYTLAQTKHLSDDKLHLIPVCISDDTESGFAKVSHIPMLDARPDVYDTSVTSICHAVLSWLDNGSFAHMDNLLEKDVEKQICVPDLMKDVRQARFSAMYNEGLKMKHLFPVTFDGLRVENEVVPPETESSNITDKENIPETKEVDKPCPAVSSEATAHEEGQEGLPDQIKEGEEEKEKVDEAAGKKGDAGKQNVQQEIDENTETETAQSTGGDNTSDATINSKTADNFVSKINASSNVSKMNASSSDKISVAQGSGTDATNKAIRHIDPASHCATSSAGEKEQKQKSTTIVYVSFHPADIKFVLFLRELLATFSPQMDLKSEFSSDQERLGYLETSDAILALLSPEYLESPQLLEEFHVALWRQRTSPEDAPLLLPIKVANLPPRPTYFQLLGCPVSVWDDMWANLHGKERVASRDEIDNVRHRIGKRDQPKLSPDEALPMTEVALILVASIKLRRTLPKQEKPVVRPALINTVKLQGELNRFLGQKTVPLEKYLVPVPSAPDTKDKCIIS